jgi:hypothetical protein
MNSSVPGGEGAESRRDDRNMELEKQSLRYDKETSDRISRGSVMLSRDTLWTAELAVPTTGDQTALLIIERHGPERGIGPQDAAIAIPSGEIDALQTLLSGIIAQARQDGVLSDNPDLRTASTGEAESSDT